MERVAERACGAVYTVARGSDEAVVKEDTDGKDEHPMQQPSVPGRGLPKRDVSPLDRQISDMSHNGMSVPKIDSRKVHS